MPRRKGKKEKIIHYVQLRTYRDNPNAKNYASYLQIFHSKIQPIAWNIDQILTQKWTDIRRREFLHQSIEIPSKDPLPTLIDDDPFVDKVFIRSIELIDELVNLHHQIEKNLHENYQYRLNSLRYEFSKDKQSLTHLFINIHFKELDHQLDVLNGIEQEEILHQTIQYQLTHRQLQEEFSKDITQLHTEYHTRILAFQSTIGIKESPFNRIVHQSRQLIAKIHRDHQRMDYEKKFVRIVKRKIREKENHFQQVEEKIVDLHEKFQSALPPVQSYRKVSEDHFRRLSILTHRIANQCREKLKKIHRIFLLIDQCERYEFDEEKSFSRETKMNFNEIISRINYLDNCRYEFDSTFDELTKFWKRFAHVQMDISIRMKEKHSHKNQQNLLQKQLKTLF